MRQLLCLAAITIAAAQGPADFSGRWALEAEPQPPPPVAGTPAPPPRPGDMGSGWGSPITITQDAKQLVVEYVHFRNYDLQPPLRLVYALDGSETRNAVMLSHASQMERARAVWDGPALGITTVFTSTDPATGKPFTTEVRHRLTLESSDALVVEVTRAGALGGKPTITRKVYKKS